MSSWKVLEETVRGILQTAAVLLSRHFLIKITRVSVAPKYGPLSKLVGVASEEEIVWIGVRLFFACYKIMRLIILKDYDRTSEWAAKYVRNAIKKFNPGPDKYFVLGLPTGEIQFRVSLLLHLVYSAGSTPLGMYKKLVEFYESGQLSFKYVKTFNMDEYVGLPHSHPECYHYFMYENLFKHIDIDPGRQSEIHNT